MKNKIKTIIFIIIFVLILVCSNNVYATSSQLKVLEYTDEYKELDNICDTLYRDISIVEEARSVNQKDIDEAVGVTEETIADVDMITNTRRNSIWRRI